MKLPLIILLLSFFCFGVSAEQESEAAKLHRIVEDYFEAQLKLDPLLATEIGDNRYNNLFPNTIGPGYIKEEQQIEEKYLNLIQTVDPSSLNGQDLLTYQIFKSDRKMQIEGFRYPSHLMPVNQSFGIPNFFAVLGSGESVHPFKTVKDYEDFLGRVNGFVEWMNQAQINMKEGVRKGYVQPKILMEKGCLT